MKEAANKKRAAGSAKKAPAKKPKKQSEEDESLARALAERRESNRNRDVKQAKSKKAAALAALKREKQIQQQQQAGMEESSDESLDFGDDDDDSDDDYEEGGLKPWQQKKTRAGRAGTSSRLDKEESDDDMDIDEDDTPMQQSKKPRKKDQEITPRVEVEATLEDFRKCTIPRRRLAQWCVEPYFEAAVLECFVRLCIGEDESGEKVYRLCEIVEVKHGETSYKMPVADPKRDKPISTNIILTLKFGKSARDFPMYLISDVLPDESDVHKYVTTQKNNRLEVLSKRRANQLKRLQNDLIMNYTYTVQDIESNLQKRRKQGKSIANLGLEQTRMAIAVQAAKDAVEEVESRIKDIKSKLLEASGSEVSELEVSLEESEKNLADAKKLLEEQVEEEKALQEHIQRRKVKLSMRSKDQNWAKVNERAVQANQRVARDVKEKKDDVTASGTKKVEFNPFARRRVKPKVLWDVGQDAPKDETKQEEEAKEDEKKESREESPADEPYLVQEPKGKGTKLSDFHQFAIDEEGLAQASMIGLGLGVKKTVIPSRNRRGLSLKEYTERKAAGTL
jgi:RNA polymerase-associated protein RTF1